MPSGSTSRFLPLGLSWETPAKTVGSGSHCVQPSAEGLSLKPIYIGYRLIGMFLDFPGKGSSVSSLTKLPVPIPLSSRATRLDELEKLGIRYWVSSDQKRRDENGVSWLLNVVCVSVRATHEERPRWHGDQ